MVCNSCKKYTEELERKVDNLQEQVDKLKLALGQSEMSRLYKKEESIQPSIKTYDEGDGDYESWYNSSVNRHNRGRGPYRGCR